MAETLGSLCDKLTIVKLKQYHSEDSVKLQNLLSQEKNLCDEIDQFLIDAFSYVVPVHKLTFSANKVYIKEGNEISEITGSIGSVFSKLAQINCLLWHEQEKVYEFEKVPIDEKDKVVKNLAILNLERNNCIDKIDKTLKESIISNV